MIVGYGDIGMMLEDRQGALFFASGVSNSSQTDESEFQREITLLSRQPKDKCLFYFSTISIFEKDTAYTRHKIHMEKLVKSLFENYNIIRIGNITWGKNPNTFLNFMTSKIKNGDSVEIRDEWKFMLTKKELLLVTNNLPLKGKNEISVFGKMMKVKEVIKIALND